MFLKRFFSALREDVNKTFPKSNHYYHGLGKSLQVTVQLIGIMTNVCSISEPQILQSLIFDRWLALHISWAQCGNIDL